MLRPGEEVTPCRLRVRPGEVKTLSAELLLLHHWDFSCEFLGSLETILKLAA